MQMYEDATYAMNLWTKNLKLIKRINLGLFGIGALISLRDFLNARLWFWGIETHAFRFGVLAFRLILVYLFTWLTGWGNVKVLELIFLMGNFNDIVGLVFKLSIWS